MLDVALGKSSSVSDAYEEIGLGNSPLRCIQANYSFIILLFVSSNHCSTVFLTSIFPANSSLSLNSKTAN
jgi:hypothetical protein